jgi:hypothetical protein
VALDPDQFLDDIVNRIQLCETALGDNAMRRTIRLFKHRIGFRMPRYLLSQCRDFLPGSSAEPKKRPEQQSVRIEEYPENTSGGLALRKKKLFCLKLTAAGCS